jgi:hypothetical protein
MSQSIFRWNGEPVAFIEDRCLFDFQGRYLGWIETDNSVWAANGKHVGDLTDGEHLFRSTISLPRMQRLARPAPARRPSLPSPLPGKRMPLAPVYGWTDALDFFRQVSKG